jgi:hypothetical protein
MALAERLAALRARPTPLQLSTFLLQTMRDLPEAGELARLEQALLDPALRDALHATAESKCSNWSYGTFFWVLLASVRGRGCERGKLVDTLDELHGLSLRWRELCTRPGLEARVLELEGRAARLLHTQPLAVKHVQRLANYFVFARRFFQYRAFFPPLEVPLESPNAPYLDIYRKYIDTRRFRKKLLGTFFVLAPRLSDLSRGFEDFSPETLLQNGRSDEWNKAAQTKVYHATLEELLGDPIFADALRLNAVDLWFKHTFNLNFKEHFFMLQKDVVKGEKRLRANLFPVLCYGLDGVSLFYQGTLSHTLDFTHAVQAWFHFIRRDHDNAVFNNILVKEPA